MSSLAIGSPCSKISKDHAGEVAISLGARPTVTGSSRPSASLNSTGVTGLGNDHVHDRVETAAELFEDSRRQRRAGDEPIGRLDCAAHQFAAENGARHLVADVKAPAAALVALAVDDGERGRAGAGNDHGALVAAQCARMGSIDVVIGANGGERPGRCSKVSRSAIDRPPAMQKAAIGIGVVGISRGRRRRKLPWRHRESSDRPARRSGSGDWSGHHALRPRSPGISSARRIRQLVPPPSTPR